VTDLRDNNSPKTSLDRVPGFRGTIAMRRLCTVCLFYMVGKYFQGSNLGDSGATGF